MNIEVWLVSYGSIVWYAVVGVFMVAGAALAGYVASRIARRRNIEFATALRAPIIAAPTLGHVGEIVGVRGTLLAETRGPVAATTSRFAWDPQASITRADNVQLAAGHDIMTLKGPIEVCTGSRQRPARPAHGTGDATITRTVKAGDQVIVYGRLARLPAAVFAGYRKTLGSWQLCAEPGYETVGVFFTGRPRMRWDRWSCLGAMVAGALTMSLLMIVGYTAVSSRTYSVQCGHFRISTPRASAVASATPVFHDWGVRRYHMYRQKQCDPTRPWPDTPARAISSKPRTNVRPALLRVPHRTSEPALFYGTK